ncbi:MAG: tRNA (N6-threonylcarbamoyladenosine(37)-N6)-methyltransferase TrmO [Firmicutes bacterium]|nr:tRNA (N6-threonylcarbamoyladenosine(37)-N6)-methyltransferase TrmO [Bacillota bacterium]
MKHTIEPIAYIKSPFTSKFGIPRQGGLSQVQSVIVFEASYRNAEALRGLEGFSHLWLIWSFSENLDKGWSPTVRPPRLGGNKRVGVFATRSPFRPNGLGLSSVKIEEIKTDPKLGPVIVVSGADLMDGTPIFDIKPYISMDCHPDAVCGFQESTRDDHLRVVCTPELLSLIDDSNRDGLLQVLAQDPRPSYQDDPERIYGFPFAGFDVRFRVEGDVLTVVEMVRL